MGQMKALFKNLLNLDKPVLTEKLAPMLAPFARLIYIVGLVILSLVILWSLALLFRLQISDFLMAMIGVCAEFALIRMFCEYLTAHKSR